MKLQNTENKTVEVSMAVRNYLVRCWCNSMTPRDDAPKGTVKAKDINGTEHEFDLTNCFKPIYAKYKEAARIKHMELIKPKSYRYGR